MIGRTLLHYHILREVGAGGMGHVFLAEDQKLKRKVALKVLPSEMAEDQERLSRFRREAEAVAALNHPNIVTIYSVEEVGGAHFLTMELVDGQPLSELVAKGAMSMKRFPEIALPLADAVAAAHAKGITHRDIKPANVMVTSDGRVKVLDFGLAKFVGDPSPEADVIDSDVATEARTREGVIVGTAPYMSPEQISGRAADPRSDVFSLGIVLFEMATGQRPFRGDTPIALLSAILKDAPLQADLPEGLGPILGRCLAKDPG